MLEPNPSCYTGSCAHGEIVCGVRVFELQTRIDQRRVFQRRWMEPRLVFESSGDVGVGRIALCSYGHL